MLWHILARLGRLRRRIYFRGNSGRRYWFVGISFAFGLTVLTMAFAVGSVSGGHFNPAVSLGLATTRRFDFQAYPILDYRDYRRYCRCYRALSDCLRQSRFCRRWLRVKWLWRPLARQVWPDRSACRTSRLHCILPSPFVPTGLAPIAIGLGLTLIHLVSIPVTNTSVNPARSTGVAFFAETAALSQLWLFWVAPLIGAALGAIMEIPARQGFGGYESRKRCLIGSGQDNISSLLIPFPGKLV
jgi:aquaporin Z